MRFLFFLNSFLLLLLFVAFVALVSCVNGRHLRKSADFLYCCACRDERIYKCTVGLSKYILIKMVINIATNANHNDDDAKIFLTKSKRTLLK